MRCSKLYLLYLLVTRPEDEKEERKYGNIANGMADSLLRGAGFHGAAISTLKNAILKIS